MKGPLFILGFGRSGTKILRAILTRNERIRIPEIETNFIPLLSASWHRYHDLSDKRCFWRFYKDVTALPFFTYLSDKGETVSAEEWYGCVSCFTLAGIVDALFRSHLNIPRESEIIWGDKSPTYTANLSLLAQLYPNAKFLHIVRDVRDCCLSANKAWGSNLFRTAQRWSDTVILPSLQAQECGSELLEIRYEDMLEQPHNTIMGVCDFLDISFSENMLDNLDSGESSGDAMGATSLLRSNVKKFEGNISKEHEIRVLRIAQEGLRLFRYDFPEVRGVIRISKAQAAYYRLCDGWRHFIRISRQRGMTGAFRFVLGFFRQNNAASK